MIRQLESLAKKPSRKQAASSPQTIVVEQSRGPGSTRGSSSWWLAVRDRGLQGQVHHDAEVVRRVAVPWLDVQDLVGADLPLWVGENLIDAPKRNPVELIGRLGPLSRQAGRRYQPSLGEEAAAGRFFGGVEVAGEQYRLGTIGLSKLCQDYPDSRWRLPSVR